MISSRTDICNHSLSNLCTFLCHWKDCQARERKSSQMCCFEANKNTPNYSLELRRNFKDTKILWPIKSEVLQWKTSNFDCLWHQKLLDEAFTWVCFWTKTKVAVIRFITVAESLTGPRPTNQPVCRRPTIETSVSFTVHRTVNVLQTV